MDSVKNNLIRFTYQPDMRIDPEYIWVNRRNIVAITQRQVWSTTKSTIHVPGQSFKVEELFEDVKGLLEDNPTN